MPASAPNHLSTLSTFPNDENKQKKKKPNTRAPTATAPLNIYSKDIAVLKACSHGLGFPSGSDGKESACNV